MKLFIKVKDGYPINHPATEENLIQVFGVVPSDWEPFERVERPPVKVYQILENEEAIRRKIAGTWKEEWLLRDMTEAEITAKQEAVKSAWVQQPQAENWASWLFHKKHCEFCPPFPPPLSDVPLKWCGAENKWKEFPEKPTTGGPYKFDYFQWVWVAV